MEFSNVHKTSSKSHQSAAICHIEPVQIYIRKPIRLQIVHVVPFNLTEGTVEGAVFLILQKLLIPAHGQQNQAHNSTWTWEKRKQVGRGWAELHLKAFKPTSVWWTLPYIIVQQHALAWVGLNRAWASHRECARRVTVGNQKHLPSILAASLFTPLRIWKQRCF